MKKSILDPEITELETIEVGWWPTVTDAELRRQQLWADGIPSILTSTSNASSMLPSFENRVGVFVRQSDFVAAMSVLSGKTESEIEEQLLETRENEMAKNRRNQAHFTLFLKGLGLLLAIFAMAVLGQLFFRN